MDNKVLVIDKNLKLPRAADYEALRALGLQHLEEMGSAQWTDYNAHDPGITILEALCYALSEMGYRNGFEVVDLLSNEKGVISFHQALFTARRILTNSALTVTDFRKLLVDLPGVRNGWLLCKQCACETTLYAECAESALFSAPLWRLKPHVTVEQAEFHEHPLWARGLYDVLLELDEDPELGDLNDRKIQHTVNYALPEANVLTPLTVEVRFPDWEPDVPDVFRRFTSPEAIVTAVSVTRFSRDKVLNEPVTEASFVQGWRGVFFADYALTFKENTAAPSEILNVTAAALRFFAPRESVKREVVMADLKTNILADASGGGIVSKYQRKLQMVRQAADEAAFALHQNRNLDEDFCHIRGVGVQDVGVCADVEVDAEADIEWVLAKIYHEIELYFNPPVRFYSLRQLETEGLTPDEIFDGPALENGFIKTSELEQAVLRSTIYASDVLNRLMDIPGVKAIRGLSFTRYTADGLPELPSATWELDILPAHLPKLYLETSRFLFYKNDLPFLPRMEEVRSILIQLRGENAQPKLPAVEKDYPLPLGNKPDLTGYEPVQHTFPLTYGIGPHGLGPQATPLRRAQAKQLKGYLMVYEQLIANMQEQFAHVGELFSTDTNVSKTYFGRFFDPADTTPDIAGQALLFNGTYTEPSLNDLLEPREVFYDRRNRFLDHLLGRFSESFREYALMLYANADRIAYAPDKIIRDKALFLKDYPRISATRARAFNYKDSYRLCDVRNQSGLALRISRLLGMESLRSYFSIDLTPLEPAGFEARFRFNDPVSGDLWLQEVVVIDAEDAVGAEEQAYVSIGNVMANGADLIRYVNQSGDNFIQDENGVNTAKLEAGVTPAQVQTLFANILTRERMYLVEHLLLRPKFPGDALMPVCLSDDCTFCGDEDPYSFRLTYVMQGELAPFSFDIDLRRFADNTIRKETPSHLLPKICWVGDAKCKEEYTPEELAELEANCECVVDDAYCRQFSRFEKVWCTWLKVNAPFNWAQENDLLHRRMERLLTKNLPANVSKTGVCNCVDLLAGYFGNRFKAWIDGLVDAGVDPTNPVLADHINTVVWLQFLADLELIKQYDKTFCLPAGLPVSPTFWTDLRGLLHESYAEWVLVSYRLNELIRVFTGLSSVYPTATLHDCDDGSDDNPVRLNNTILGTL